MNFNEYQALANRTSANQHAGKAWRLTVAALGLAGESGEFADLIKKFVSHNHPLDNEKAIKELGDILWYIAEACTALCANMTLEDIARINIEKLKARYPNGFESERSINRVE